MAEKYRTAPHPTTGMPPGVPYIVANEAAERFSYYGMRSILVVFMTQYLLGPGGALAVMNEPEAKTYYHQFLSAVYLFPLLGAPLADIWLGKYRTIFYLSLVYCLGHLALSLDETRLGLFVGLTLIAIGSGGIKPCVSANVGDQFGPSNKHLLTKVYGWFYFSINAGSMFSTIVIPRLLHTYGSSVAFAVPGVLMLLATFFFWMGRYKFVHVPPGGMSAFAEGFTPEGLRSLGRLAVLFLFLAVFWSLYDQTSSAWVLQAGKMNLPYWPGFLGGGQVLPAETHTLNPVLILLFIPIFSYGIYPLVNRVFPLTSLRKIGIGLFVTALAFVVSALIEHWIEAGERPHFAWQALAYCIMTAAEVMVSITALEFSYTQAPPKLKAIVMAMNNFSVSLGNQFTALVNLLFRDDQGQSTLRGANYYLFFTGVMLVTAVVFALVSHRFKEHTYIQPEAPGEE